MALESKFTKHCKGIIAKTDFVDLYQTLIDEGSYIASKFDDIILATIYLLEGKEDSLPKIGLLNAFLEQLSVPDELSQLKLLYIVAKLDKFNEAPTKTRYDPKYT